MPIRIKRNDNQKQNTNLGPVGEHNKITYWQLLAHMHNINKNDKRTNTHKKNKNKRTRALTKE